MKPDPARRKAAWLWYSQKLQTAPACNIKTVLRSHMIFFKLKIFLAGRLLKWTLQCC
jgi:hypothetical protein